MYIPDPIELMEIQGERLEEEFWDGEHWHCCECGKAIVGYEPYTMSPHPCAPPVCHECLPEKWKKEIK